MQAEAIIIVKGMVQSVGFRYFVMNLANRLGLTGFVKNLHNGDVEIVVQGDRSLVNDLIHEVRIGPRFADVRDVKVQLKQIENIYQRFDIL